MKIPAGQSLILDKDLSLNEALEVEGVLVLDPMRNVTLTTNRNIIVTGNLISQPDPAVTHTIRFTGIDESKFVGGGDTVLDSDIGMWVMGAGQLDLIGAVKDGWKLLGSDATARTAFAAAATSNMRFEGTAAGQSHLFIKSSRPQSIKGVMFRYMGPRKDIDGDKVKELVTGRYACHFHHSEDGSRGSIIEGCIARDCSNHIFVPHGSHGIIMRGNITYNTTEHVFWYDFGHRTHDLVWENNLVVKVGFVARSQDQDSDGAPTFGAGGFVLGSGNGNKCNGNVVISTSGDQRSSAAYIWPELRDDADNTKQLEDSWEFNDNTAINCPIGISVWQNNLHHHIVRNTTIINCPMAIQHGAYQNHYRYIGGKITGGYINVQAASATTNRVRFEEMEIDAAGLDYCVQINEGPLDGEAPVLFRACKFSGYKLAALIDKNPGAGLKSIDLINCNLNPSQVKVTATKSGETVRIQNEGSAWSITKGGSKAIGNFAPSQWGTGTGLKAEYFSPDFKTKYLERVEPNVNLFDLTHPSPHYMVPTTFAVRWTGKIQPQYSTTYKFICKAGGGVRLWINGALLIDAWSERYPGEINSKGILLDVGKLYDFKLEFYNVDDRSGCTLEWTGNFLTREFIPMSQLYPTDVKPPEPPVNKVPVANAGQDQNINLYFTLSGSGSDTDGTVIGYKWEQVSGPGCTIIAPTEAVTNVRSISAGTYVFKLTVIDDKGATGSDQVTVVVG